MDVIIIGSGAGGGVAASVLTAAGYSVLVLEKGSYAPPETHNGREGVNSAFSMPFSYRSLLPQLPFYPFEKRKQGKNPCTEKCLIFMKCTFHGNAGEGFERLYEKAGLLTTSDGSIAILAGSTLGGGTTVNWYIGVFTQSRNNCIA